MKRVVLWLVVPAVLLLLLLTANTLRLGAAAPVAADQVTAVPLDTAALAERLAGAIRIPTVSYEHAAAVDGAAFAALADYLRAQFPLVHAQLSREVVAGASLLYRWQGRNVQAAPLLLLAHLDVVPVETGTEDAWLHAPFSGAVEDGYVWGRGTLDNKSSAVGWLEAVEHLLAAGHVPEQTVYLAFGHDEEIGGDGARALAALLLARGVHADFVLDEGGAITHGVVAGLDRPVASVMTAEKGYVSFRLTARAQGGHSSMPPSRTAVGRLARAVVRLQDRPMPARLTPPIEDMLQRLAPEMALSQRVVIANRWLFEPLLLRALSRAPVTNALIRTTAAPTMFNGGIKDNVLPAEARATVNFRLLPGDSIAGVEAHLREAIADDEIAVEALPGFANEASTVSATDTAAFRLIQRSVNQVFPDAVVASGLVTGGTDARHYDSVAASRYNFLPVRLQRDDLSRIHGANERIAVEDYANLVRFYIQLLRNGDHYR